MKETKRRVLIAEEPLAIRNVLYALSAGIEADGSSASGVRKRLDDFAKGGCDGLILDLRTMEAPHGGMPPRIKNVRGCQLGRVAVVTCDVSAPMIVRQIEELCHPHFNPRHLIYSLIAFFQALF
jgi:hypothetical protein